MMLGAPRRWSASRLTSTRTCCCEGKFLDALVVDVGHEDIAVRIDGNALRCIELTVGVAEAAPLRQVATGAVELLDARIALAGVRDVDVAAPISGNADGNLELAVAAAF